MRDTEKTIFFFYPKDYTIFQNSIYVRPISIIFFIFTEETKVCKLKYRLINKYSALKIVFLAQDLY